jgi:hypothetical protein
VEGEYYGNRPLSAEERIRLRRVFRGLGHPKYLLLRLVVRLGIGR